MTNEDKIRVLVQFFNVFDAEEATDWQHDLRRAGYLEPSDYGAFDDALARGVSPLQDLLGTVPAPNVVDQIMISSLRFFAVNAQGEEGCNKCGGVNDFLEYAKNRIAKADK